MKKVKIMLLSLALFAVVGGALAFKAKFNKEFCTTIAYFDASGNYYCSFNLLGTPTTTQCQIDVQASTFSTTQPVGVPVLKVCTTTTNGTPDDPCSNLLCETSTWTIRHD